MYPPQLPPIKPYLPSELGSPRGRLIARGLWSAKGVRISLGEAAAHGGEDVVLAAEHLEPPSGHHEGHSRCLEPHTGPHERL